MWMLVLFMVTAQGPMFQAHPKPMSEAECNQAKIVTENQLAQMQAKAHTNMKATLACVQWPGEMPSETNAPAAPEAPDGGAN